MSRRKQIKITPVLITLNILVLFLVMTFFGVRMLKYYKLENTEITQSANITLYDNLINKQSYVNTSTGLIYDEEKNTYSYKGNVSDNYLYYSGIMFRIVGIDNANNVKLVTDDNITLMYSGLEKGFDESYINKWLNSSSRDHSGVFENNLYNSKEHLKTTYTCDDVIDDLSKITCEEYNNEFNITLLSLFDYSNAGGKDSYLNIGEAYYINTLNKDNNNYYVSSSGEVGLDTTTTKVRGVRPLITIDGKTKLISGKGTQTSPYVIESHEKEKVSDLYVGEYISYSNMNWKIVEKSDSYIKVALNDVLKDDETKISKTFGGSSNKFSTSKNTIGYYLNNTFYNSLMNKDYLIKENWYIGSNVMSNLDYAEKYDKKVSAYVGMLSLGELFVGDIKNVFTITPGLESSMIINTINESGIVFGDLVASQYNIRPAIYINNSLLVDSGKGTQKEPYIIKEEGAESETSTQE